MRDAVAPDYQALKPLPACPRCGGRLFLEPADRDGFEVACSSCGARGYANAHGSSEPVEDARPRGVGEARGRRRKRAIYGR